jgi:hypothetical protein
MATHKENEFGVVPALSPFAQMVFERGQCFSGAGAKKRRLDGFSAVACIWQGICITNIKVMRKWLRATHLVVYNYP